MRTILSKVLFPVVFLLASGLSLARDVAVDAREAYTMMHQQVDSLLAAGHLSDQSVTRVLAGLDTRTSLRVNCIHKERWLDLVATERHKVLDHYVNQLLDEGRLKQAATWLDRFEGSSDNPVKLLLQARFHAMAGDSLAALSEALTALYFSRSPRAEAASVSYFSSLGEGTTYPVYRDAFLQKQAEFRLTPYKADEHLDVNLDRYIESRLFGANKTHTVALVAFWDEYLTVQDKIYLKEVYQAARAHGSGFMLCYAGEDTEAGMLHLPPGIPIAGIEIVKEAKSASKYPLVAIPTVMVVTRNDKVFYQSGGTNKALPALLPGILKKLATYEG